MWDICVIMIIMIITINNKREMLGLLFKTIRDQKSFPTSRAWAVLWARPKSLVHTEAHKP